MVLKFMINCTDLTFFPCRNINLVLTNRKYKQSVYLTLDAGSKFSTDWSEGYHLLTRSHNMNTTECIVYEADNQDRDKVMLGFLIGGPIYLTALTIVILLVIYQKLDLRRIRRNEERFAEWLRALEEETWIETRVDVNNNRPHMEGGARADTLPMFQVDLETLAPHSTDRNYVQLEHSTFQVSVQGEWEVIFIM